MIITQQNREAVLQTFREYPAGLSISDLSLRCGVNRNKCSQICSDYHKMDILGLIQKSSYKIYFLKHHSVLNQIIESIHGPVLVVNEMFAVIGTNKEYNTTFKINPDEIIGRSAEETLYPIVPDLIQLIKEQAGPGMGGKTATFPDETGAPRCRTLTIALNESQFCIIILKAETPLENQVNDPIKAAENQLKSAVPVLMTEKTWPDALREIAKKLHQTIPDTLIVTLLIDEPASSCTIHTVATPQDTQQQEFSDRTLIQLSGIELLQYKTTKPVTYYTGTQESLQNTPLPEAIKTLCMEKGISSISLIGISSDSSLISVLGIGTVDSSISTDYVWLLSALSGYLTLLGTVCETTSKTQKIQAEYQKHYSEIYALLTEKNQENVGLIAESEHLRAMLGSVLDLMKIYLIVVTRQGTLVAANKTACTAYQITQQQLTDKPPLPTVLPPDLAASLMALVPDETGHFQKKPYDRYIEEQQSGQIHWYLFSSPSTQQATSYLFIGEKQPAKLVKSLKSLQT